MDLNFFDYCVKNFHNQVVHRHYKSTELQLFKSSVLTWHLVRALAHPSFQPLSSVIVRIVTPIT